MNNSNKIVNIKKWLNIYYCGLFINIKKIEILEMISIIDNYSLIFINHLLIIINIYNYQ